MATEGNDIRDLDEVILKEGDVKDSINDKSRKRPKRVLQFSDGVLEEYSSEDETDGRKETKIIPQTHPGTLRWMPWAWYQTVWIGGKMLDGCDYVGECLASFFGITAPKYQFEINEYYRLQALENEMNRKQDLEMGGWVDNQNKNNLITNSNVILNTQS